MDMNISPLQKARYEYAPKLPGMLRHGIADICVKEGEATQSVADQDKIKALFPNTYGKNEIDLSKSAILSLCLLRCAMTAENLSDSSRLIRNNRRPHRACIVDVTQIGIRQTHTSM